MVSIIDNVKITPKLKPTPITSKITIALVQSEEYDMSNFTVPIRVDLFQQLKNSNCITRMKLVVAWEGRFLQGKENLEKSFNFKIGLKGRAI